MNFNLCTPVIYDPIQPIIIHDSSSAVNRSVVNRPFERSNITSQYKRTFPFTRLNNNFDIFIRSNENYIRTIETFALFPGAFVQRSI